MTRRILLKNEADPSPCTVPSLTPLPESDSLTGIFGTDILGHVLR